MTLLWLIGSSLESGQHVLDLEDERPPRFAFVNRGAVHEYWRHFDNECREDDDAKRELMEFNGMPVPILRIADPAFRLDFFQPAKFGCASLRLRQALDLTDAVIRYRDIDIAQSAPAVRAQEYQAFHVVTVADPIDWSRTASQSFDVPRPDGSIRRLRFLAHPLEPSRRVYWREDFTPPAPLFRAAGTPWTLATDPLADRVMRAGITDLVFQDVTSDRAQTELVLRQ